MRVEIRRKRPSSVPPDEVFAHDRQAKNKRSSVQIMSPQWMRANKPNIDLPPPIVSNTDILFGSCIS
jgi:hypothetical protein